MKCWTLTVALSFALSSCLSFEPPATAAVETQAALRIDETSGAVEWFTIDRGVQVRSSNGVAHLEAVLGGARIFPVEGGDLGSVNLDELKDAAGTRAEDGLLDFLLKIEPDVSVVGVGLTQQSDGRLTVWRHTRLARAAHWLARFQRLVRANETPKLGEFPTFDAPTLERVQAARAQEVLEWRIEGRSLVYEIPSSSDNARLCEQALRDAAHSLLFFALGPGQCSHDGQRFSARLTPGDDGWIRGALRGAEFELGERSVSVDELRAAGFPIETPEQLRARLAKLGLADLAARER